MFSIQLTCDAPVAGFQVGGEVPLARSNVDQTSDADVTRPLTRAVKVEVRDDVIGTADVELSANASSDPHPTVIR